MRIGTSYTAIVVGANLSLLWLFPAIDHLSAPDHRPLRHDAPIPARLHGHTCYRLAFSNAPWSAGLTPHVVELVDSLWSSRVEWRKALLRDPERPFSRWWMAGADSIDMAMFTEGPVGVVARVSIRGDTLIGRAWGVYDAWDSWVPPDAIARATRIPCELRPAERRARSGRP